MKNITTSKLIYPNNENKFNLNYPSIHSCNCCTYSNSFFYCTCDCHKNRPKEKYIQKNDYSDPDFENMPNLNINELKMKSLKDYSYENNFSNYNHNSSLKNLNPSKSSTDLGNYNINTNNISNSKHLFSLKKRIENNLEKIKITCINKSQETNYINNQKNLDINNVTNNNNTLNDLNFKEVASHYKTQNNFNTLKKYYQLNNTNSNSSNNINENINYINNSNNTLKSQIEFHKLLNSIKGNDINNNLNINVKNSNMPYNTFTEREKKHYTKINGYNLNLNSNPIKSSNTSNNSNHRNHSNNYLENYYQQINYNNTPRHTVNYNRNNRILEKYKELNYTNSNSNSNFTDFCSNTEYNKPFRSLNIDNGNSFKDTSNNEIKINNIYNNMNNINNDNINNNTSVQISSDTYLKTMNNKNNYSSRNSLVENNNINDINNNINQNGGLKTNNNNISSVKKLKLDDDSISYNSSTSILNKSYNKLIDLNSNNISHAEPRYSNTSKNTENDNVNIKLNFLDTKSSQSDENKNEMVESKDINCDNNNNFIVTFGARNNNDIKNIIASVKNEIKDNGKNNENSDQKINNIIIDYENLKKRYAPNKLFTGLQNNIKDLNQNINSNKNLNLNLIQDNYSNNITLNTTNPTKRTNYNYSKYNFEIYIQGDSYKNKNIINENEKYKKEINNLNNELKESKNKIEELNNIINDYQKEIYALKNQMTKSKRDYSLNESKITLNNISTSNNNINYTNKTKIGKDSFIIKIPENLKRNNLNKDKKSRNNSLSNTKNNNNTYSNIISNSNRNIQEKYYNIYNFNNTSNQISQISNNTNSNSNCLTNNNISSNNISTNNIFSNNNAKEIYVKKITTTMKKKMRKCTSQKLRINKVNNNNNLSLEFNNQDNLNTKYINFSNTNINKNNLKKNNERYIYTLYQKDNKLVILSFDVIKKEFNFINFADYDNFELNYNDCYHSRGDNLFNNNSIFTNNNNNLYIVTGKNTDILYLYDNNTKSMNKLCKFKNNHAKGSLLIFEDKIFCLSGNHNKKTEFFSQMGKNLGNLEEINIERSNFSACIYKNKYIFVLFGYNYPTHQYLDSIEFYEFNNENEYEHWHEKGWKYFKYKNDKIYNLKLEGHLCFNFNEEKIIFFGGINSEKTNSKDNIYELVINIDNMYHDSYDIYGGYVEKIENNLNDIYKNGSYFFGSNNKLLFEENNNWMLTSFDNSSFLHILDINRMNHNVYYFE